MEKFCKDCKINWVLGGVLVLLIIAIFGQSWNEFLKHYDMFITGVIPIALGGVAVYYTIQALKLTREQSQLAQQQAHEATIINAWNVLTTPAPGSSGKKEAIETLAKAGKSLNGIDLSTKRNGGVVDLRGLDVSGCELNNSNWNGAILSGANFKHANLSRSNFENANLSDSDFTSARLVDVNFENVNLRNAILDTPFLNSGCRGRNEVIFKDCWVPIFSKIDTFRFPQFPQHPFSAWKVDFMRDENGEKKTHKNEKGQIDGY